MQPPPGYSAPPPARKGMPAWAWVLIGCVPVSFFLLAVLAAILFPVFARARDKARQVSCESNERQISLGLLQYVQDYDQHYPAATAWMDRTGAYVRSEQPYHCPSAWGRDPAKYGYAFNSKLAGGSLSAVSDPRTTTALYDSTDLDRNAADPVTSLPDPGRHLGGNNVAYGDGHVALTRSAAGP